MLSGGGTLHCSICGAETQPSHDTRCGACGRHTLVVSSVTPGAAEAPRRPGAVRVLLLLLLSVCAAPLFRAFSGAVARDGDRQQ